MDDALRDLSPALLARMSKEFVDECERDPGLAWDPYAGLLYRRVLGAAGSDVRDPNEFYRHAGRIAYQVYKATGDRRLWDATVENMYLAGCEASTPEFRVHTGVELARMSRAEHQRSIDGHALRGVALARKLLSRVPDSHLAYANQVLATLDVNCPQG